MNSRIVKLTFLLSVLALFSCKKKNDNVFLANEATQGFDGYSYTDTFTLLTSTIREDSIKTDSLLNENGQELHNLVGVINDDVFGKYQAASFFQFRLTQTGNVLSGQVDSAVLFLQYLSPTAYYGNLNSIVDFNVVEVNEAMNSSRTHSNHAYSYNPTPIGTFSGKLRPADSTSIREFKKNQKVAPCLAIKLSPAFASYLFNANATALGSQESFMNYFKGLGILPVSTPSPGNGSIAAINMFGPYSRIRVYYNDSSQSDFKVQTESERLSTYTVSNQGIEIIKQKSSALNADFDTTYALAMAGAKTRIKIPHLFGIVKNNGKTISVGKAEIIIRPLAGTFASPFTLPTRMLLLQPHPTTNLNASILDVTEIFYGGRYDAAKNEYRFNITRHIQSLFTDYQVKKKDNNRGLFLTIPSDYPIAPSRIIMDMRKKMPNAGIEFKLIYTEI